MSPLRSQDLVRADVRRAVAILLCAGYGTRMGELTAVMAKPLLPVAGRPVIDYLLDQLVDLPRLEAVWVVSNSRYAEGFHAWAAERRVRLPFELEIFDDGSTANDDRRGAAGDLGFVLAEKGLPDAALVAAGDNVLRFSLAPFWGHFLEGSGHRVLALKEPDRERLRRTGVLEIDDDGRVHKLWEKPDEPPASWMCPPFYALRRSALERVAPYLESGASADEIGRFIGYLAEHEPVRAERLDGERLDIGSPESYRRADEILRREAVFGPASGLNI